MKKEIFEQLKKELTNMGILLALTVIIFQIAFFKENFLVNLRTVLSLFWLFVLPGYALMFYWKEKLGFLERLIVGIMVSGAIIGILSYYFGIIGINIRYHTFLLPILMIIVGFSFSLRK